MPDFTALPLAALAAIFAAAAAAVWVAGTRLSGLVDGIARRTGLGKAFTGMLLLGGITSLPEVATVGTSAAAGNAPLAVNNLLGTASINLLLLAIADAVYGRRALTSVAAAPATLMQGTTSVMLALVVAVVITAGDISLLGGTGAGLDIGLGAVVLLIGAAGALWISSDFESRHVWEVVRDDAALPRSSDEPGGDRVADWPLSKLVPRTLLAALVILCAGFLLSMSADGIARQTGLASGMVGFLLVGLATSLPEISSILAAVRMREYQMAVGDIFGTNLFNLALIFLADLLYDGGPVLAQGGTFEVLGALLAALLTCVYVVGLLERRDRTLFRIGYDSAGALLLFGGGVALLSQFAG